MSHLIYDPEKDFLLETQKLESLTTQKDLLLSLHDDLSTLITELSTIHDVESFQKLLESNFLITLQSVYDRWPNGGFTISRSKTKLFVYDFKKFISKSKKQTVLKKDKLDKIINEWFIENEKLYVESVRLIDEIANQTTICDRFSVKNGSWIPAQVSRTETIIKQPQKSDRIAISLDYIKPNIWYAWPNDLELISKQKYKPKDAGIGAGENWLAYIFGGEVQGSNSLFDIALLHNDILEKWEVKEYDEKSLTIRLGSNGTDATEQMSLEIYDIVMQLKTFCDVFEKLHFEIDSTNETLNWLNRYVTSLSDYLKNNFSKIIIRGELSNIDLQELVAPIQGANAARELIFNNSTPASLSIKLNNRDISYSIEQSLDVFLTFSDVLSTNDKLFALISTLKHPILLGTKSYKDFLLEWVSTITPSQAFKEIEGVFLVHKNGFRMIPHQSLNESFEYIRMSQGRRPNFKVCQNVMPNDFKQISFFGQSYSNAIFGDCYTLLSGSIDTQQYIPDEELFAFASPWNNVHINTEIFNDKKMKIIPSIC